MRIRPAKPDSDRFRVRLDWRAYFNRFCQAQGEPVEHKGRWLFKNGWTYALTDYSGPEWEPPADTEELRKLKMAYWAKRRSMIKHELITLKFRHDGLRARQADLCCPLQEVVAVNDVDGKPAGVETRDLQLDRIKLRIEWLEGDLEQCDGMLRELRLPVGVARNEKGEVLAT